jgi:hypothetical protein
MVTWLLIEKQPDLLGPGQFFECCIDLQREQRLLDLDVFDALLLEFDFDCWSHEHLLPRGPLDSICSVQIENIFVVVHWIDVAVDLAAFGIPQMDQMIDTIS